MRREQLWHIARAAAEIAGVRRVLIVGSQAVLGTYSDEQLPDTVVASTEADVVILDDLEGNAADRIDGAIGLMSQFHKRFGYFAEGVELTTAKLPVGWRGRRLEHTVPASGEGDVTVYFPELHDLCAAKLAAGRIHDRVFVQALWDADLIDSGILNRRTGELTGLPGPVKDRAAQHAATLGDGRRIHTPAESEAHGTAYAEADHDLATSDDDLSGDADGVAG